MFAVGSPERVIAHGWWRQQRGRRPSMSYRGYGDPETALMLAEFERYEVPLPGFTLSEADITRVADPDALGRVGTTDAVYSKLELGSTLAIDVERYGPGNPAKVLEVKITALAEGFDYEDLRPGHRSSILFEAEVLAMRCDYPYETQPDIVFGYILPNSEVHLVTMSPNDNLVELHLTLALLKEHGELV